MSFEGGSPQQIALVQVGDFLFVYPGMPLYESRCFASSCSVWPVWQAKSQHAPGEIPTTQSNTQPLIVFRSHFLAALARQAGGKNGQFMGKGSIKTGILKMGRYFCFRDAVLSKQFLNSNLQESLNTLAPIKLVVYWDICSGPLDVANKNRARHSRFG